MRRARSVTTLALAAAICAAFAAPALAGPAWRIDSLADTTVAPGDTLAYLVQVSNAGDAAMDGSQISILATLPSGMTAVDAAMVDDPSGNPNGNPCTAGDGSSPVAGASSVLCTNSDPLAPPSLTGGKSYQLVRLTVRVDPAVDPATTRTLTTAFAVSGGGAPAVQTVDPTTVATALPGFGVDVVDGQQLDAGGTVSTQAGAHPASASVSLDFNTTTNPEPLAGIAWPVAPVKDVLVDLPPGLVGDPAAVDQCTATQLANSSSLDAKPLCPATSQVGTTVVRTNNDPLDPPVLGPLPVFNLVPPPGVPARFGFNLAGTVVVLDARVRNGGDYGISVDARNIPEALSVAGTTVTLWGVPSDTSHDLERACPGDNAPFFGGSTCRSPAARVAFLRNPTSCTPDGVGLPTTVRIDSWFDPGTFATATFFSHRAPAYPAPPSDWGPRVGMGGCDHVPFTPTLEGQPQTRTPNSPSGFAFDLSLPQPNDPSSIGESDLRTAVVALPRGVRVNPSAADGLQACSSAQIHLHDGGEPQCPDAAKVGSVTIDTPLLRDPLQGSIYLAAPGDNPFGTLLALYLVAEGHGVILKFAGRVDADAGSGQLTATFDNNPQAPFTDVHLQFDGGPRAQLVTPRECGGHTTNAVLTGWNGRVANATSTFTISGDGSGGPCPAARFSPGFGAGTESNGAGRTSSLAIRFTRDDLDQELGKLSVSLPSGLTGRIANVVLCSDADANAGTCPDGTKIGDVTVGAGAGSHPFYITDGRAYLTGPYKGAPFGVAIVVRAKAGPFDLGNVSVRSALFVDKHSAAVSVVSDSLPAILQGIPLQVRDVRVNVDRPGFFLNPTSCAEKRVSAVLESTDGMSASVSDRFQAADCASLGFKPRMSIAVGGRHHTDAGEPTPFTTRITMPGGNANLSFVRVTLPRTLSARLTVINDACTRAQFETDIAKCAHAQAGTAVAVTPLLRDPLRGKVYFVKNGHPVPDLFVALRGQVAFDLIGRITIPGGTRLRTTFATAPDVPIRSFTLRLFGDRQNGSVGAATNLCTRASRAQKVELDYIGQNGRVFQTDQALRVGGCPRAARRRTRRG